MQPRVPTRPQEGASPGPTPDSLIPSLGGAAGPCAVDSSLTHYAPKREPFLSCLLCPWPSWHQQYWPCVQNHLTSTKRGVIQAPPGYPPPWGWWASQKAPHMKSGGWPTLTLRASVPAPTSVLWGQTSTALQTSPRGRRDPVRSGGKWGAREAHPAWGASSWPQRTPGLSGLIQSPPEEPLGGKADGRKWTW